ncbi:MAG: xylulokinase [Planctomycetota bacterium]|jgi:xylulokinase
MFLLGYDIGSSSVKAVLLDAGTGVPVASATSPETEMEMIAERPGWAEQHPEEWWVHVQRATAAIRKTDRFHPEAVGAIGIAYQMHGLVIVDRDREVLRPAILWCDSRACGIGEKAFEEIGRDLCLRHLLNSPGNFTASKLKWVQEAEPHIYDRVHKALLPGDYIALKMTGQFTTTASGLSEGILWDFRREKPAWNVLEHFGIERERIPDLVPTFAVQGELTRNAAEALGLRPGTPLAYRAGDQPNNAFSLGALDPGEIAATAGTSGVVYAVADQPLFDPQSRVNTFVHVNHEPDRPRFGVLLCINGTGSLIRWLCKDFLGSASFPLAYDRMNRMAARAPVGSEGLIVLPFGNGAERTLENRDIGASLHGLDFNRHTAFHVLRASQEGIAFAMRYGLDILGGMGIAVRTTRAGAANLFQSPLFARAFATVTGAPLERVNTDGAQGAARGAGVGAGIYASVGDAFAGLKTIERIEPDPAERESLQRAYSRWVEVLTARLR